MIELSKCPQCAADDVVNIAGKDFCMRCGTPAEDNTAMGVSEQPQVQPQPKTQVQTQPQPQSNVGRTYITPAALNAKMIDRVHKAKTGCSACGKRVV